MSSPSLYIIFQLMIPILLIVHIASGFTALICALGAMLATKGQSRHRYCGRCFFYAMTGVFVTALPLAFVKNNLFLFLIAVFSYYLAFSGWRYANNRSGLPHWFDWFASIVMLMASLVMMGFAIHSSVEGYRATVLLIFGITGGLFSLSDLKSYYQHDAVGNERIAKHLGAMLGATIAALTAFSVTNIPLKPPLIVWLGPTVLLVPVIIWWKRKVLKGKT